jgi:Na+/H+-dicarboxylate symporter/ABC-type amino acid transport substrate-binding protein
LLALLLGVVTGLIIGEMVAPLEQVGIAFIRMLQITVIPYICVALITGLGRLEYHEVKRLAVKGGSILMLLWALAITLVALVPLAFPDWPSRSLFQQSSIEPGPAPDFIQLYIPSNPFFSLANGIVPAVVVFSIMIGLALTGSKKKDLLIEPLSLLSEVLSKITRFVASLAPIGVFALMANTAGTMDFTDLARLQVYIVIIITLLLIIGLWFLPGLVSSVTPLGHREVLNQLRTPLITAFATGSSLVVLPMLAEICKKLLAEHQQSGSDEIDNDDAGSEVSAEDTAKAEDEARAENVSSVDVLIPTFFSFPTIGAIMSLGFVLFSGWYIGMTLSAKDEPMVLFSGLASLFGGTALAIPFTLELAGLPRNLFQVFLSIDVIISRFGTFVSVMHYATIALIGSFALANMMKIRIWRLLGLVAGGFLLIFVVLTGVRAFYTHVVVVPYTKDEFLRGLKILQEPQDMIVYKTAPVPSPGEEPSGFRSMAEINKSGFFRACYVAGNYPLTFFNSDGQLVGFDVEMAQKFAARLDLKLEMVPLKTRDDLLSGYCDALFNSQILQLDMEDRAVFTNPFETVTLSFIVPNDRRGDFASWSTINELGDIPIALSPFQGLGGEMAERLPQATAISLGSLEEQVQYFESNGEQATAFLDAAEEGAAWTVLFPRYVVVVPRPVVRLPVGYLVAADNPTVLNAMNNWLAIESANGYVEEIYAYWIEGKTENVRQPRWSIIRDVLGWVD